MTSAVVADDTLKEAYLELLKKSLTCSLYRGMGGANWEAKGLRGQILKLVLPREVQVQRIAQPSQRANGSDWPAIAQTMIGSRRLDNLQECVETVLRDGVPGDFIETGVWRGGACILIKAVLRAHQVSDRVVWLADSFAGLPKPNAEKYPADAGDRHHRLSHLAIPLEEVRENFRRYDLLDEQVKFLKGWFKDTLPKAPIEKLAVARLDGDLYESTTDALENLYDKLSVGGFLIVDDYGAVPACKRATEDFRARENIREEIKQIDGTGVYWRRER
ncbi:MAG TPA: TylF/MycF family methyltransferase [Opitutaceae bacterium]|nr:TylF/MycF family methyltransferase [Opitutaceae bacterium]